MRDFLVIIESRRPPSPHLPLQVASLTGALPLTRSVRCDCNPQKCMSICSSMHIFGYQFQLIQEDKKSLTSYPGNFAMLHSSTEDNLRGGDDLALIAGDMTFTNFQ